MYNKKHLINLMGYLGIGFIGGAISHGFFSETRSLIMAAIGIILFLVSEYLNGEKKNYLELFLFGLIYSIAVGMVSGGFQHFLDGPERSLWIIPVGYLLSLIIYPLKHRESEVNRGKSLIVGGITSIALVGILYGAIQIIPKSFYTSLAGHHSEGHEENTGGNHSDVEKNISMSDGEKENLVHLCLMGGSDTKCVDILNPANKAIYGSLVKKVCDMMPMPICQQYLDESVTTVSEHEGHTMNHGDMINSEFDFIALMIPHHQEAVDTSKRYSEYQTTYTGIATLAQDIVEGQSREISMMQGWLNKWYSGVQYTGMAYMPMMHNLPFEGDIENGLADPAVRSWAKYMVVHHEGAVQMAEKLLKIMNKQDPLIRLSKEGSEFRAQLKQFAKDIIVNQSKEITQMKGILQ